MEKRIIRYRSIGIIHSKFKKPEGTPIQPTSAEGVEGMVEVFPEYSEGLKDIEGFSHIILIYHFHLSTKKYSMKVVPYMDERLRGVFATRAPCRPNPIGISTVRLLGVRENILYVRDIDIVDGTPLLDIKPYVPEFDSRDTDGTGWLKKRMHRLLISKDDGRFSI